MPTKVRANSYYHLFSHLSPPAGGAMAVAHYSKPLVLGQPLFVTHSNWKHYKLEQVKQGTMFLTPGRPPPAAKSAKIDLVPLPLQLRLIWFCVCIAT